MWYLAPWTKPVLMEIKNGFMKYPLNPFLARTIFEGSALYPIAEPTKRFCKPPFFFQSIISRDIYLIMNTYPQQINVMPAVREVSESACAPLELISSPAVAP